MTNTDCAGQQIDQEIIVRSLAELFADEEGVPLIDYASTLHQLSQRDDDSFRSSEETASDGEGWNPVFPDNDNQPIIQFNDACEFWQTFKLLLSTDRKLSKSELEALKSEIRFQHQRCSSRKADNIVKTRRKSSVRRRKVYQGEIEGTTDALLSPTATTRLRVRKVSKPKDDSSDIHTASRGRSPHSHRERKGGSLPRRASSGPRRSICESNQEEMPKSPKTPNARASSRSKGRTRRLSIGKSPRRMNDSNEQTEDLVDDTPDPVTDSPKVSQLYLSTGDVEKIKQVVAARSVKPMEEKAKGSWLDTPKALLSMAMPGSSKPSSPGTKSPKADYKHQHEAVISWVRVAPANGSSILKRTTQRRVSTTTPTTTPPTHSRNNSGDLTPHARQLHTIPMGSLFSFKSGYDT